MKSTLRKPKPGEYSPDYARYEHEKRRWQYEHPAATPSQYQEAMAEIARECGITPTW